MSWLKRLFRDGKALTEQKAASALAIDGVASKLRAGTTITDDELESARTAMASLFEALAEFHGTKDNTKFPADDGAELYVQAVKLAATAHPDHDAWPVYSVLRKSVLEPLRRRVGTDASGWVHLAAIQPALLNEDVRLARECFTRIEGDPLLSRLALGWAHESVMAFSQQNHLPSVRAFLAAVSRPPEWNGPRAALPDPRRWPLLASMYPFLGRDPRNQLKDARPAAAVRAQLQRHWDISDRAGAKSTLEWLRNDGHRAQLETELDDPNAAETEARAQFVRRNREALANHELLAWDLCRLIAVARASHAAGFLAEEETWDEVLGAAAMLRDEYRSWEELGEDYVLGNQYFDPEGGNNAYAEMVRWLMRDPQSPWRTVTFGG